MVLLSFLPSYYSHQHASAVCTLYPFLFLCSFRMYSIASLPGAHFPFFFSSFSFFFLSFFFTCLFLLLPSSTWSKSSMNDYPVRGTEQMDRLFLVAFRCSSAKSVWLHHHIFKKTRLSRKRSKGLGMGSAAFAISMGRVLVCSVKAAKKRRFCFQTHRTWAFIWSAQFDFDVERDPRSIAINFSGCISCACPYRVYVPSVYMSHCVYVPTVCISRRVYVSAFHRVHVTTVCVPRTCTCPLCVCPLHVYVPSVCIFLYVYVAPHVCSSVCMSSPCVCPRRVSLAMWSEKG